MNTIPPPPAQPPDDHALRRPLSAGERLRLALAHDPALPVVGDVDSYASGADSGTALARTAQLRSHYLPKAPLAFPLGLGDYLSLLFYLDEHNRLLYEHGLLERLTRQRSWYFACCMALGEALGLSGTPFDTLEGEQVYIPREMVQGLRPLLRQQHGAFQAVYYEIALGGLLRQRADILRAGRSVTHVQGGPGSGIKDEVLRARIQDVYFTRFDQALLDFSYQLLDLDSLINDLLPLELGPAAMVGRLVTDFGYPDGNDPEWETAFA